MNKRLALLGGNKLRQAPFAPHPVMGEEERQAALSVIESGNLSGFIARSGESFYGGPKVQELEKRFVDYFGVKHAVACNSATAALHMAVAACGVSPGDEVIVTPYTMSASATAILMHNAIPVFADVEDKTFCLDPKSLQKAITKKTKAIVVVHLFGQSADMDAIMDVAKKNELKVIEDCAQAPGATYNGKLAGTFGDAGIFSFNQHKTITTGEGGVLVTNSERIARVARLVRNHGEVVIGQMGEEDIVNTLGWNYRMTELEAAIGIEQFKKLDRLTARRIELADYLTKNLEIDFLAPPYLRSGCKHVYFLYAMKFDEDKAGISRDLFVSAVSAEGIPIAGGYVRPVYLEPVYQKRLCYGDKGCPFSCAYYKGKVDYSRGICPTAERMHFKELIGTGICRYPLTKKDMDDVVAAFNKVADNIDELKAKEPIVK